ncbi:MAG: TetR/AcrR family transcriptional regulator, partial [Chitinophagaceae bacterium]|nr:TetR/AcrR family transcriptional regulator [Chitinophagaceae bacterium]
ADVNTDVVAKVRLETMMLPFNQEIFPKNKFNLVDLEKQLIEYYLFGVASLKGYKLILRYQQENLKKLQQDEN